MADEGFGSGLWRQLSAVRLGRDGEIEAPVRADGRQGVVVGVDQVAARDAAPEPVPAEPRRGWWARLSRRRA